MNKPPGPGRVVQSRLSVRADGGMAEVALDSNKNAWARCITDGENWTPWVPVASHVVDVDVAAGAYSTSVALVIVTPGAGRAQGNRTIFSLRFDGTIVATSF